VEARFSCAFRACGRWPIGPRRAPRRGAPRGTAPEALTVCVCACARTCVCAPACVCLRCSCEHAERRRSRRRSRASTGPVVAGHPWSSPARASLQPNTWQRQRAAPPVSSRRVAASRHRVERRPRGGLYCPLGCGLSGRAADGESGCASGCAGRRGRPWSSRRGRSHDRASSWHKFSRVLHILTFIWYMY
jgi:hypothetical protein